MNAYIFVAAAVFAVIPFLVIFKVHINKLVEHPKQINTIFKQFFIGIALSKIIPAILLVFGIIKLTDGVEMSTLYIPWLIILIVSVYGYSFISSQKNLDVDKTTEVAIQTLTTIARPLLFSIPIMSAIFIFLMTL
jgi:F0F1-type ATP synthase membrane subunit c/vacuolar-type H+-ATPase subunit K